MQHTKPSHSSLIRDYLKEHPSAGAAEVIERRPKKKIKVTPTLVYNVKMRMARKAGGKGGRPPAALSGRNLVGSQEACRFGWNGTSHGSVADPSQVEVTDWCVQ